MLQNNKREITPEMDNLIFVQAILYTSGFFLLHVANHSVRRTRVKNGWFFPEAKVAQVNYYMVQSMKVSNENFHPKTV